MEHLDAAKHYEQLSQVLTRDVPFWINQARKYGGPVLELACGTGRISIPIAREGFEVTGVDISDEILAEAKRKAFRESLGIEWLQADIRDFQLGKKYALVILPLATLCFMLHFEDLEACLSSVRAHLRSDGKFIIDAYNPRLDFLTRDPEQRYPYNQYQDPENEGIVVITHTNRYDSTSQINTVTLFYNLPNQDEEIIEQHEERMYFPQELEALLKSNGFKVDHKFGDYDEASFVSSSLIHLVVSSLRE